MLTSQFHGGDAAVKFSMLLLDVADLHSHFLSDMWYVPVLLGHNSVVSLQFGSLHQLTSILKFLDISFEGNLVQCENKTRWYSCLCFFKSGLLARLTFHVVWILETDHSCVVCVCVGDTRWCPAYAGAEVSKIGNDYKKSMAYRKVSFWDAEAMGGWSCEVHQRMRKWCLRCQWNKMKESMHDWVNEPMNQWIDEPMNQRVSESMN